ARTAVTHAAWEGRAEVTRADIRRAALLALPHRRRRNPFDAPGLDEDLLDQVLGAEELPPEPPEEPGPPDGGGPGEAADKQDPGPGDGQDPGEAGQQPDSGPGEPPAPGESPGTRQRDSEADGAEPPGLPSATTGQSPARQAVTVTPSAPYRPRL